MAKKEQPPKTIIVENRKARFNYFITEYYEAGIMLTGSEVKSLRLGKVAVVDSYAQEINGELWLMSLNIASYKQAGLYDHEPTRPRKLLLKKTEVNKLIGAVSKKGLTLVPIELYFNKRGLAKVTLGLAKGKENADKRQTIKDREWNRNKSRILKGE